MKRTMLDIQNEGLKNFKENYTGLDSVCYESNRPRSCPDYVFQPFKEGEFEIRKIGNKILLTLSLNSLLFWENQLKNK